MNLNVYMIRDNKSGTYSTIYTAPNDVVAIRSFCYDFREYQFRTDLELYRVGSVDTLSGRMTAEENAAFVTGYVQPEV